VNETSAAALPPLLNAHRCLDLIFLDDGHKFDSVLLELYYAQRLLKIGGLLVFHDVYMPSVRAAISFVETNLNFVRMQLPKRKGNQRTALTVFVKNGTDHRDWEHFSPFNATSTSFDADTSD
jgi:predicted O-methyltransferase YrrM